MQHGNSFKLLILLLSELCLVVWCLWLHFIDFFCLYWGGLNILIWLYKSLNLFPPQSSNIVCLLAWCFNSAKKWTPKRTTSSAFNIQKVPANSHPFILEIGTRCNTNTCTHNTQAMHVCYWLNQYSLSGPVSQCCIYILMNEEMQHFTTSDWVKYCGPKEIRVKERMTHVAWEYLSHPSVSSDTQMGFSEPRTVALNFF